MADRRVQLLIRAEDRLPSPLLDEVIKAGVDLATHYYRHGQPGRGAYELARLAVRVNRLLDHQQQGETA